MVFWNSNFCQVMRPSCFDGLMHAVSGGFIWVELYLKLNARFGELLHPRLRFANGIEADKPVVHISKRTNCPSSGNLRLQAA